MNLSLLSIRRLLLICGALCTIHFAKAQVTQQEFEALKHLYNSLGNPDELFNWRFTPTTTANDVNSFWIGLRVESGHVTNLELVDDNLAPVPGFNILETITSNFSELKILSLNQYDLNSSIPTNIGNLTKLEELKLQSTRLTGAIPASVGNLTQLKVLDLSGNYFNGTIPAFIGNLSKLSVLDLSNNDFDKTIPTFIGNLTQLEQLDLSGNRLNGTIAAIIGNLTQLKQLDLSRNQLDGTIPAIIGNLTQLKQLDLSKNQLSGTIPAIIGNLTQLEYLYLADNQLDGNIPSTIGNLTQLERLHLFKNNLSGSIPDEIGSLVQLHWLKIADNQFTGVIPASLGKLTELGRLNLSHNNLNGSIPNELGALVKLSYLNLSNNKLQGAVPAEISLLGTLRDIELQNNQLSALPDLSGNTAFDPTTFKIDNNKLHFGHILPNISKLSSYAPQAKYLPKVTVTIEEGLPLNLDGIVEGNNNTYKWYKDGKVVFLGRKLSRQKVSRQDAGDYVCKVTNHVAPDLTLESNLINVKIIKTVPTLVSLTPANDSNLPEGNITFTIRLSKKIKIGRGEVLIKRASDHHIVQRFDAITLATGLRDNALTFSSSNLAAADYYIMMSSGVVTDLVGNSFAGINNETTWSFSVQDCKKPGIMTLFPANHSNQVNAASLSALKITFSEEVTKGTGDIHIKNNKGNALVKSIDIQSNQVVIQGNEVTINLRGLLTDETSYFVTIPSTAFKDIEGNFFDGIQKDTDWQFTLGDPQRPVITHTSPEHNSTDVSVNISSLGITFSETVTLGTSGEVTLRKVANDEVVAQITIQSGNISLEDQSVHIPLTKPLEPNTQYYVHISPGSFQDLASWIFVGINDKTTWQFSTDIVSSVINQPQATVQVHPNPATDIIHIALEKNPSQEVQFEVITPQGKVIKSGILGKGVKKSIRTSEWPRGNYLLHLQIDQTTIIKKILKK